MYKILECLLYMCGKYAMAETNSEVRVKNVHGNFSSKPMVKDKIKFFALKVVYFNLVS